jgi:hypothetical protein
MNDKIISRIFSAEGRENYDKIFRKAKGKHICSEHAVDEGECSEGCCDRYRCTVCSHTWLEECPD